MSQINKKYSVMIITVDSIKMFVRPKQRFSVIGDRVRESGCPVCHNKMENTDETHDLTGKIRLV